MTRIRVFLALALVVAGVVQVVPPAVRAQTTADGWVVLPVDEYRALRDRTIPSLPQPVSPVEATLTRVDYTLRIEGDTVAGQAALTMDVLRDGWTRVLIPSGLLARSARVGTEPVSLVEGPPPFVLLARAGRTVVTLDIAAPLSSSAGTESLTLPPSPSSVTSVSFSLPRGGMDLSVSGGFVSDRVEDPDESRWTVVGRPSQRLTLSWKRKVDDRRAEQPLKFRARVTEVVGLSEDMSQLTASVRLEVVQGLARELAVTLPPEITVSQVDGATVSDWEVAAGILRVRFLDPVAADASFVIQGEARAPRDGRIVIPLVRVTAAEREGGGVAVDVVGAGEIVGRQARGLDPADPSELGDVVAGRESPAMMAFRLRPGTGAEMRSLSVDVVRYTPQAVLVANVEEARYRVLASEDGRRLVEARYAVRNNQRSFLKVTLPAGSSVWSASVAGRPTRPGVAEGSAVLLPLEKGRAGATAPTFLVTLLYLQSGDAWPTRGQARVDLPMLDLPVSRTGLQIHHSPRYRVSLEPGVFRVETDSGPSAEAFRLPSVGVTGGKSTGSAASLHSTSDLQSLIDQFRNDAGGRTVVGSLPVDVPFPALGPSLFFASELTAETRPSSVSLVVKRSK